MSNPTNMEDFIKAVKEDLTDRLSDLYPGIHVEQTYVEKAQGESYEGIRLQIPGQVAAPVMNVEPFYEKVTTSVPYREVIEKFIKKFEVLYPKTEYVNRLTQHSWGQKVIRFYDPDLNLIEVGTPM